MEFRVCEACLSAYSTGSRCPSCQGALSLVEPSYFLGRTFGKYRLEAVLGVGGMGVVYRAVHTVLNKPAALKLLVPALADEEFLKRFLREAQILGQLKHPNIVEVYDFDRSEWGAPYYVMEYLTGQTLRQLIAQQGPDPDLSSCGDLLCQIVSGLAYAHRTGLVHRDLKPDNIFVTRYDGGRAAKIIDFGIAKLLDPGAETAGLTTTGTVMGTLNYLAPEQVLKEPLGPHTDQYALGLICAEMALGKAVRAGKTLGEICAVEIKKPLSLEGLEASAIPARVKEALLRATQPDPAARYSSVVSFLQALGFGEPEGQASGVISEAVVPTVATPRSAVSHPPSAPPPERSSGVLPGAGQPPPSGSASAPPLPSPRRGRRLLFGGLAAALLLAILAGLYWTIARPRAGTTRGAPSPGSGPAKPLPLSEKPRALPAPPDTWKIVGQHEDTLILEGKNCVYLMSEDSPQNPVRIGLSEGQRFLGASAEGQLFFVRGGTLTTQSLLQMSEPEKVLAKGGPDAEAYALSRSGCTAAARRSDRIEAYETRGGRWKLLFSAPTDPEGVRFAISDDHLAVLTGQTLSVYAVPAGAKLWEKPFYQGRVNAFALHEGVHLLSIGGWFDSVFLFDLQTGELRHEVPHRGQTLEVAVIPDYPTLAIAGEYGFTLWRPGAGAVYSWEEGHPRVVSAAFTGRRLLVLDDSRHEVLPFPYRGIPIQRRVKVSDKEIWSLAADSKGQNLYVGGADGNLYVLPVEGSKAASWPLHTQGVTALALAEPYLASSSDDKTIAIWQVPSMKVIWRSKAHAFLINALFLTRSPEALWSTSSDGTLKKWSWHQLDELEVIDATRLVGRKASMATLWVQPGEKRIVAGTHAGMFVAFEKGPDGTWRAKAEEVPSASLYSCVEVPDAEAVLFAGLERYGCYVYDLKARRLGRMGYLETCPYWVIEGAPGRSALMSCTGALVTYDLRREADGALSCGMRGHVNTDLGTLYVAAWLPGRDLLALGNAEGEICFVRAQDLAGEPLVFERFGP